MVLCTIVGFSQTKEAIITIENNEDAPIISKHIYGHFRIQTVFETI